MTRNPIAKNPQRNYKLNKDEATTRSDEIKYPQTLLNANITLKKLITVDFIPLMLFYEPLNKL
jgi:hypothetical protein